MPLTPVGIATALSIILLASCAAEPPPAPPPVGHPPSWGGWIVQENYAHEAAAQAFLAGRDGNEVYRSSMTMACATYRLQLTDEARTKADAECAAIAAMPRPVTTDCNPNRQGGFSCTTH